MKKTTTAVTIQSKSEKEAAATAALDPMLKKKEPMKVVEHNGTWAKKGEETVINTPKLTEAQKKIVEEIKELPVMEWIPEAETTNKDATSMDLYYSKGDLSICLVCMSVVRRSHWDIHVNGFKHERAFKQCPVRRKKVEKKDRSRSRSRKRSRSSRRSRDSRRRRERSSRRSRASREDRVPAAARRRMEEGRPKDLGGKLAKKLYETMDMGTPERNMKRGAKERSKSRERDRKRSRSRRRSRDRRDRARRRSPVRRRRPSPRRRRSRSRDRRRRHRSRSRSRKKKKTRSRSMSVSASKALKMSLDDLGV